MNSIVLFEMSRLIILSLFLALISLVMSHPSDVVYKLNLRMRELYNAKDFSRLVKEVRRGIRAEYGLQLYTEDAIVEVKKYGIRVKGHQQIESLLSNTAFGKIDRVGYLLHHWRNSFRSHILQSIIIQSVKLIICTVRCPS